MLKLDFQKYLLNLIFKKVTLYLITDMQEILKVSISKLLAFLSFKDVGFV